MEAKQRDGMLKVYQSSGFAKVIIKQHKHHNSVRICFLSCPKDDHDLQLVFQDIMQAYNLKKPFVKLYDTTGMAKAIPMNMIFVLKGFFDEQEANTRKYVKGCAIISSGKWVNLAVNGLFKLRKPACPIQLCDNEKDAINFLKQFTQKL